MTDLEFRDAVYEKYNKFKQNKYDKDFIFIHKHKSSRLLIATIITIILMMALGLSAIAATYYFQNIWKKPEPYSYDKEKEVTQEHYEKSITENEATSSACNYIFKFTGESDEVVSCELVNDPSIDETFWNIETKNGVFVRLEGDSGSVISMIFPDIVSEQTNFSDADVIGISEEIMTKIEYSSKGYELAYSSEIGGGIWQTDYCKKYNGIFNPYQCIRIRFSPATKQLLLIRVFDEEFENNPYIITKEEAIKKVEEQIGKENIESINAEQTIEKMNAILYQETNDGTYRTDQIVRNIWLVKFLRVDTHWEEMYYVDGTTGEFIGADKIK